MSYDSDVSIYTEDGRIKQVEYAMKAMNLGSTTVAVTTPDHVIIVSEKKLVNPLQVPGSIRKHFTIHDKIVTSCAGISADASNIITKCRNFCLEHESLYSTQIPSKLLLDKICYLALKFSEKEWHNKIYSRPFGVSLLVGIYENDTPRLFCIDPSGSYTEYSAKSIGSASELVDQQLVELNRGNSDHSVKSLVSILKGVMQDGMTPENVEVTTIGKEGIKKYTKEELKNLIVN